MNTAYQSLCARLMMAGVPDARFDAVQLYKFVTGRDPRLDNGPTPDEASSLRVLGERRAAREPLQYLLGEWDFMDFTLKVGRGVLCPRADSEVVCEAAIELFRGQFREQFELSRAEESMCPESLSDFSVSALVKETSDSFQTAVDAQGKKLSLSIEPELSMRGQRDQILRLCSILLDNAVKYCLPDGTITVSLYQKKRLLCLEVQNPCENLEPDQVPRLFDRFYRADDSRARASGGYGIGLSIARRTAKLLNGEVASEFTFNALCAAGYGVPSVFLAGDEGFQGGSRQIPQAVQLVHLQLRHESEASQIHSQHRDAVQRHRPGQMQNGAVAANGQDHICLLKAFLQRQINHSGRAAACAWLFTHQNSCTMVH